ncbi:MAG: hypothetical protein IT318_09195 [Anaerolineales bacterium]|nr:hypothetical protein [Anaerolineales bacterium]
MVIEVVLHDGLRLAGSLLAAGAWPEREQAARPYKPHRAAQSARRRLGAWRTHPAVQAAQALAGAPSPGGAEALFAAALAGAWPAELAACVDDFVAVAQPAADWAQAAADWQAAEAELRAVLARADLARFLAALLPAALPRLAVFPNLLYPGRQALAVRGRAGAVWLCQPPPAAWGASPPWRYDERPDEVLGAMAETLARTLIQQALPAEHTALSPYAPVLGLAAAVLFLRQAEGPAAGDQLMLMEQRARGLPSLPAVVAALAGQPRLAASEAMLHVLSRQSRLE